MMSEDVKMYKVSRQYEDESYLSSRSRGTVPDESLSYRCLALHSVCCTTYEVVKKPVGL